MPTKRHKPEEVVAKLRQVDVLLGQGKTVADAVRVRGTRTTPLDATQGLSGDQEGVRAASSSCAVRRVC